MLVARELGKLPGVRDAAVLMGTEANKGILKEAGLLTPEAEAAQPNDLIIAVSAEAGIAGQALDIAETLLQEKRRASRDGTTNRRPRSIHSAVRAMPQANLAVVSVTGRYAADEARDALHRGLHVLLFSDNVTLDEEIALKEYARNHGLLLMGPGAGTTILNGVALGFANVLPAGPVGIVSAAGTGLQEVSTLLAKQGTGITQGLGVGGRDLSEAVGGIMMREALKALQADPSTEVIVLISKPPAPAVAGAVLDQVATGDTPAVVCFLGDDERMADGVPNAVTAATLQESAQIAGAMTQGKRPGTQSELRRENQALQEWASSLRPMVTRGQTSVRGLFSGGTLCYEAQVIWREMGIGPVYSNAPLPSTSQWHLPDSTHSQGHTFVDLGEEEFTVGRPHPMIDNTLRIKRLLQEARDPSTAVILLDVVLGYGAHPDPAAELGPAILQARAIAGEEWRGLPVIASVTGTQGDPQGLTRQVDTLTAAGVVVCDSNAAAARLAGLIVC
jgi:succinyl-CoA synthetase alpha subunit